MCTCGAFCGRLWQSPVKEMIQVQGFGSEKVLQLLYGERMRCHLLDSKWRSGWGRPSPPPSPPSPWLYNNCICIMTIFFPTFFPQTMCNDHEILTMPQISRCLFPNSFDHVTSVICVSENVAYPKITTWLGEGEWESDTPPKKKNNNMG